MYESGPLLGTRAKYRKLSFMLSDAILSGHGWFMSLSGAKGVLFKPRGASVGTEGLVLFFYMTIFKTYTKV